MEYHFANRLTNIASGYYEKQPAATNVIQYLYPQRRHESKKGPAATPLHSSEEQGCCTCPDPAQPVALGLNGFHQLSFLRQPRCLWFFFGWSLCSEREAF